jgi:inhibitor of cysteine peptidase
MRVRTVQVLAGVSILVIALALGTVACSDSGGSGDSSSVPVFHEGDTITVKNGQEFVISLTANPSTGYTWDAGKNDKVKYLSSKQVNATNNAIGAPGTQELKFKAVATGTTTLELAYARQFEGGVPPAQTASFDVKVNR